MYNILEDSFLATTASGFGYTYQPLSQIQLIRLSENKSLVSIPDGSYIGILSKFGMDIVCSEARVYSDQVSHVLLHYKEFLQTTWISHGDYNYNTDYSTPMLTTNLDPEPYKCEATSEWDSDWYRASKAFNQTNADTLDCWYSSGAPPQSLLFYFPYPKVVNKYAIQARNHSDINQREFPQNFVIQGNNVDNPDISNDSHWTTLDSRTGVADPGQSGWSPYFTFSNSTAYHYYRLKVTASRGGNNYVSVANLKLVEANRVESVNVSVWKEGSMTWNGSYYSYSFPSGVGVEEVKYLLGNGTGSDVTVSGIELQVSDSQVSLTGVVASGIYYDEYLLTDSTLEPKLIRIKNDMGAEGQPHLLFKYTGNYDIDRNIFLSPDYPRTYNKEEATWYGIDYGYTVPEYEAFQKGIFVNTNVYERGVVLDSTSTSGSWRSPVLDTQNLMSAAYLYGNGNLNVYVRASEEPPPLVNFLVTATDPSHRWLMYDHKRVYIDSEGTVIGSNICAPPEYTAGNKIWRDADTDWAGTPLNYHGSINAFGTASFLAPGFTECADISPEQEFSSDYYWYNLCACELDDDSFWTTGTSVSGLPYGEGVSVLFTKTFPVDRSNGFFCFSVVNDENTVHAGVNLSFVEDGITRGSFPLISIAGGLSPTTAIDVAYDQANNGWWVLIGFTLYKVDPGSVNNVRIFMGTDGSGNKLPDEMLGYIWKLSISQSWNRIVSIPTNAFSYFWALSDKTIYLYEDKYEFNTPKLIRKATIDKGVQVDLGFEELHCGCCDEVGNLWALDLNQERIIRVNLQRALEGHPQAVDYENQIAGAINLWAHPTDGCCYVLITDEPEHPNQDIIRKIHVSQPWGSQGKYMCAVPGFCSESYKYGVSFTGRAFDDAVRPHNNHLTWGVSDTLPWVEYNVSGRSLPRGRYKQIRVDFIRDNTSLTSPKLEKIRVPTPIKMEYLSKGQDVDIAIKSTLNNVRTAGSWDTKLRVWWYNEEI